MNQLTSEQLQNYEDNGYIIIDNHFSREQIEDFQYAVKSMIRSGLKKAALNHPEISVEEYFADELHKGMMFLEELDHAYVAEIYDMIAETPEFMRLISHRDTSTYINQILKREQREPLYTFTCRSRIGFPGVDERYLNWHQEVFYTIPESQFVQTWAPLVNDARTDNGTVIICEGSHKEEVAPTTWVGEKNPSTPYKINDDIIKKYNHKIVEMKTGQLLIFSRFLIHKSGDHAANEVRYSLIGMYHNTDNPKFYAPIPRCDYRNKSSLTYFEEHFKTSVPS